MRRITLLPLAALLLGALWPADGRAKDRRPHKVLRLDEITVEGHIQKPQAFYILQRSSLNYGSLTKTESFLPKVVQSVDKDPF